MIKCQKCSRTFNSLFCARLHQRFHLESSGEEYHQCSLNHCGRKFRKYANYVVHKKRHKRNSRGKHKRECSFIRFKAKSIRFSHHGESKKSAHTNNGFDRGCLRNKSRQICSQFSTFTNARNLISPDSKLVQQSHKVMKNDMPTNKVSTCNKVPMSHSPVCCSITAANGMPNVAANKAMQTVGNDPKIGSKDSEKWHTVSSISQSSAAIEICSHRDNGSQACWIINGHGPVGCLYGCNLCQALFVTERLLLDHQSLHRDSERESMVIGNIIDVEKFAKHYFMSKQNGKMPHCKVCSEVTSREDDPNKCKKRVSDKDNKEDHLRSGDNNGHADVRIVSAFSLHDKASSITGTIQSRREGEGKQRISPLEFESRTANFGKFPPLVEKAPLPSVESQKDANNHCQSNGKGIIEKINLDREEQRVPVSSEVGQLDLGEKGQMKLCIICGNKEGVQSVLPLQTAASCKESDLPICVSCNDLVMKDDGEPEKEICLDVEKGLLIERNRRDDPIVVVQCEVTDKTVINEAKNGGSSAFAPSSVETTRPTMVQKMTNFGGKFVGGSTVKAVATNRPMGILQKRQLWNQAGPEKITKNHHNWPAKHDGIEDRTKNFKLERIIGGQEIPTVVSLTPEKPRLPSNSNNNRHMSWTSYNISSASNERWFKCTVCQHQFTREWNLKNHMRTHTGERPFSCHLCDKNFAMKHHLKRHIGTHLRYHLTGDSKTKDET